MKSSSEIEEICKKYGIDNYDINPDGSIDVNENVILINRGLTELPLDFNRVSGNFFCNVNELTTLKGCPKYVGVSFDCGGNRLTSLEFGPIEVGTDFYCNDNKLTSLEFSPKIVGGWFVCNNNDIRNIKGISDNIGSFLSIKDVNPIGSIINMLVDIDFVRAFNSYRVIKDDKVILKRLKYVMETFGIRYNLNKIKKHYEII